MDALRDELKSLIVDTLELEDVAPSDIGNESLLFGEELGLDSIDALEIAMVLEERYGVTMADDPEANGEIFMSIDTLAKFVAENRKG
jgi:acyl carrier protein